MRVIGVPKNLEASLVMTIPSSLARFIYEVKRSLSASWRFAAARVSSSQAQKSHRSVDHRV